MAAAPGRFADFAETPVLKRIAKELDGNLTVGQLKGGAAGGSHIGSKQLLRADLVDADGTALKDDALLIENGERSKNLFFRGADGKLTPLGETDSLLQTTKAQNANLLTGFLDAHGSSTERALLKRMAGQRFCRQRPQKSCQAQQSAIRTAAST